MNLIISQQSVLKANNKLHNCSLTYKFYTHENYKYKIRFQAQIKYLLTVKVNWTFLVNFS